MRLTAEQIRIIREETQAIFGGTARVRLFGSRLDDTTRGGDIDLLVESDELVSEPVRKSLALTARLQMRWGDQPIDVLLIDPANTIDSSGGWTDRSIALNDHGLSAQQRFLMGMPDRDLPPTLDLSLDP